MTRRPLGAYLAVFVSTLIWGTLHPVGKLILAEATASQLAFARALMPAIVITGILALAGRGPDIVEHARRMPVTLIALGLLSFGLSSTLSMAGLAFLPASVSSLLANTSPLMLAVGVTLTARRRPSARVLVGLALGFGGVGLLVLRPSDVAAGVSPIGAVLSLLGSFFWAIYTGWGRRVLLASDPLIVTALAAAAGATMLGGLVVWRGELGGMLELSTPTLLLIVYAGVIGTAVTYALWMTALRTLSATSVIAFQYVIPLAAVSIAVALLGEQLDANLVVGGLAVLIGVGAAQEGWSIVRPGWLGGRRVATGGSARRAP